MNITILVIMVLVKLVDADYSALAKEIGKILNQLNLKLDWKLVKEIFTIDTVLKTDTWTYKIKHLKGETIIRNVYEKELLLSNLKMNYYPEQDIHISEIKSK